ncbi:hypothetical protein ACWCQS_13360 [Streptomyces sp. NPDC002076]
MRQEVLRRPAAEPPRTAVHHSLLAATGGLDGGLTILVVGAPPHAPTGRTRRTHVLTEFEDGISSAPAERFAEADPEEPARRCALRTSVLARAAVGAVRAALLVHTRGDEETTDPRRLEDCAPLHGRGFAALRTQGGAWRRAARSTARRSLHRSVGSAQRAVSMRWVPMTDSRCSASSDGVSGTAV